MAPETPVQVPGLRFYSPGLGRWVNRDPIGERGGLNVHGFVGNGPVGSLDIDGRVVRICCGDVGVSMALDCAAKLCGKKHCWLSTDTRSAGMGQAGSDELTSSPCCGTETAIREESRSRAQACYEIPGADEECVNDELVVGKPLGEWGLHNNCNTFVAAVLGKCNGRNLCKRWVFLPPELPGEIPLTLCAEWTAPPDVLPPVLQ